MWIELPVHDFFPFFYLYCTLIILEQNVLLNVVSLRSHKQKIQMFYYR